MTQEHPITSPSKGLVLQWSDEWYKAKVKHMNREQHLCLQAARWGADMELKECCLWVAQESREACRQLQAHRRPKMPGLREQSIALIDKIQGNKEMWDIRDLDVIRQALESLPS